MSFADAGTALPLIKSGQLRALAVTSAFRLPTLPDIPTFAEASGAADFEAVSWHVLYARITVPKPIVDKLHATMVSIMADPEITRRVASLGLLPHPVPPIEDSKRYIQSEIDKWGDLVRSLGLAGKI
jgi:tripartite-type tricarboxylate transporter receptor subunit TctC